MDWGRVGTPASCHTGQTQTDEPQCPAARPSETSRDLGTSLSSRQVSAAAERFTEDRKW